MPQMWTAVCGPSSAPTPAKVVTPTESPQQPNSPQRGLLPPPEPTSEAARNEPPQQQPSNPEGAVLGTIGLILGIVSSVCVLLGLVTCCLFFPAFLVAIPISLAGVGCSAFGRGKYRTAGLVINSIAMFFCYRFSRFVLLGFDRRHAPTDQPREIYRQKTCAGCDTQETVKV